jgi:hypothetical protein
VCSISLRGSFPLTVLYMHTQRMKDVKISGMRILANIFSIQPNFLSPWVTTRLVTSTPPFSHWRMRNRLFLRDSNNVTGRKRVWGKEGSSMQTHQSFMRSYCPWLGSSGPATSRPVLLPSWMNSDEPAPGNHMKIGSYHAQERLRGKPHTETDNSHPSQ